MENPVFVESQRQIKSFMWGYFFLGLIALIGGIYAFTYRVNSVSTTLFGLGGDLTNSSNVASPEDRVQELTEMKLQDSDGDGLNDFDEQFTYNTSINLTDTDSDGVADNEEVAQGQDPTCPTGQECAATRSVSTTATTTPPAGGEDVTFLGEDATDEELREELTKLGVPADVINEVSGEDLRQVYFTVANEYKAAYGNDSTTTTDTTTSVTGETTPEDPYSDLLIGEQLDNSTLENNQSFEDLDSLTPEQIREILLQGGVSQEELDSIDDEALMQLYQETLQQEFGQQNQ